MVSCGSDGLVIVWPLVEKTGTVVHSLKAVTRQAGKYWHDESRVAWLDNEWVQYLANNSALVQLNVVSGEKVFVRSLDPKQGEWRYVGRDLAICISDDNLLTACTSQQILDVFSSQFIGNMGMAGSADTMKLAIDLGYRQKPVIFDSKTSREMEIGEGAIVSCNCLRWSPNATHLAIVGGGLVSDRGSLMYAGSIHLIDGWTGEMINRAPAGALAIAWAPDARKLATSSIDGVCEVFNRDGLIRRFSGSKHRGPVRTLDWHPGNRRIASGGADHNVQVWDPDSGETLLTIPLEVEVTQVAWSPDGSRLLALDADNRLHVWDSAAGEEFAQSEAFRYAYRQWSCNVSLKRRSPS